MKLKAGEPAQTVLSAPMVKLGTTPTLIIELSDPKQPFASVYSYVTLKFPVPLGVKIPVDVSSENMELHSPPAGVAPVNVSAMG